MNKTEFILQMNDRIEDGEFAINKEVYIRAMSLAFELGEVNKYKEGYDEGYEEGFTDGVETALDNAEECLGDLRQTWEEAKQEVYV